MCRVRLPRDILDRIELVAHSIERRIDESCPEARAKLSAGKRHLRCAESHVRHRSLWVQMLGRYLGL
jgi:Flp pilus assembly CpaF family ATPase